MGRPVRPTFHAHRETAAQQRERAFQRRTLQRALMDVERIRPRVRSDCHPVRLSIVAGLPDEHLPACVPGGACAPLCPASYKLHRPCPFIGCRYHLHADVDAKGTLVLYDLDIRHTCALDVVDDRPEGVSREEIAVIARMTAERTRVHERQMEAKIRVGGGLGEWRGHESAKGDSLLALAAEGEG